MADGELEVDAVPEDVPVEDDELVVEDDKSDVLVAVVEDADPARH